jgi:hypothetical protein
MMKKFALASVLLLLCTSGVFALCQVDLPVSKRYALSKFVIVGKITAVNGQTGLIEAVTVQTLKGTAAPATFQVHAIKTPTVLKTVAVGQAVVVFAGQSQSVIHIADQWLSATTVAKAEPRRWLTFNIDSTGHRDFPGTTAALIPVVEELRNGAYSLIDVYDGKPFSGGMKEMGKLPVTKPVFMIAADINGDGKPDLIVGTAEGIKLFLATGETYADATEQWGLSGVAGSCAAAGDINGDGKIGLLIGKTLYRNDGKKLIADSHAIDVGGAASALAVGLVVSAGNKAPDAALLFDDGRTLLFKNPGHAGQPWAKAAERKSDGAAAAKTAAFGDFSGDGKPSEIVLGEKSISRLSMTADVPADDFARLTGEPLDQVVKAFAAGMKNPAITRIDINGDNRPDLVISSTDAALVLINRGFGAFLVDKDAGAALGALAAIPLANARARCAMHRPGGKGDDLLILSDEGKLFLVTSPVKP